MNLALVLILAHFIGIIGLLGLLLWLASRNVSHILEEGKISPVRRFFAKSVLVPARLVGSIFRKRKEEQRSVFARFSHSFVAYCSRIPYFHFFPKFLVALSCELLIEALTGNHVLTGIVSLWSFSFLVVISIVESRMGELEKKVVTMANIAFFRISILITLGAIVMGKLFWKTLEPYFDNQFWHGLAFVSHALNEFMREGWAFFWGLHPGIIVATFCILGIYIFFSLQEK